MAALLPALSLLLPLATAAPPNTQPDGSCLAASSTGLLLVGGYVSTSSAEVWAPPPEETHCTLPELPSDPYMNAPTVDTVKDRVLACSMDGCLELTGSGWEAGPSMLHRRTDHTSAVTAEGLLLVGGSYSPTTTELLPAGHEPSMEGFTLQPGRYYHCSIQLSADTIVLTGGVDTESLVTEHSGLGTGREVTTRELPALLTPRFGHACGVYTVGGSQMLIVTGGTGNGNYLSSTELMEVLPEGSWREAGPLPSARYGLRGASLASAFHVSGGNDDGNSLDEILAWDPVSETWSLAGHQATARRYHGITEVSLGVMEGLCAARL